MGATAQSVSGRLNARTRNPRSQVSPWTQQSKLVKAWIDRSPLPSALSAEDEQGQEEAHKI